MDEHLLVFVGTQSTTFIRRQKGWSRSNLPHGNNVQLKFSDMKTFRNWLIPWREFSTHKGAYLLHKLLFIRWPPTTPSYLWISDKVVFSQQKGVFRVNCIDCLDRTNVVQVRVISSLGPDIRSCRGRSSRLLHDMSSASNLAPLHFSTLPCMGGVVLSLSLMTVGFILPPSDTSLIAYWSLGKQRRCYQSCLVRLLSVLSLVTSSHVNA